MLRSPFSISRKVPSQMRTIIAIALILSFVLAGCSSITIPQPQSPETEPVAEEEVTPEAETEIEQVEITFRVEIPANTDPDAEISLTLLDEVTGLALNSQVFPMEAEAEEGETPRIFTTTIPFALGSVLKYRYERQTEDVRVGEHTSEGGPVRYRLYYVEGEGAVEDVISRWTDTSFAAPSGRIMGETTDSASGLPVPNLLIVAGGMQTLTASDGSFLLEGLPPGIHNLVVYALDGAYHTFQQGAEIAADSTTPAPISLVAAEPVTVIFHVTMPADTPPIIPVRIAGNLLQFGNTFANLAGGVSTVAARMPVLSAEADGQYTLQMELPAGADIRYKYTLGDGFWNAEHRENGEFRLRQLIVPDEGAEIEDTVASWRTGDQVPLTFSLTTPPTTPVEDSISIQLNPLFGWTESIPMWKMGDTQWAYILFSPLNLPGNLSYRYCRNGQCGRADDLQTSGTFGPGRPVEVPKEGGISIQDTVSAWNGLGFIDVITPTVSAAPVMRQEGFLTGVEFEPTWHPNQNVLNSLALRSVRELGSNAVVLTPTWSFTRQNPPVLEPVTGRDPLWNDTMDQIAAAGEQNLRVILFPQAHFPEATSGWWAGATRDYSWWLVWFTHYRTFLLNYADMATQSNAQGIVIGGSWLNPALPNGVLMDGSSSGVPLEAESRWRDLLFEVRQHFHGTIYWALPAEDAAVAPSFLNITDVIYLLWAQPLSAQINAPLPELEAEANRILDAEIQPLQAAYGKPVVLAVGYPSLDGGASGCRPPEVDPAVTPPACPDLSGLPPFDPNLPQFNLDLQEQMDAYAAVLSAASTREWITGFISRGYYPPAAMQDKLTSIHGKPSADYLASWFHQWTWAP